MSDPEAEPDIVAEIKEILDGTPEPMAYYQAAVRLAEIAARLDARMANIKERMGGEARRGPTWEMIVIMERRLDILRQALTWCYEQAIMGANGDGISRATCERMQHVIADALNDQAGRT